MLAPAGWLNRVSTRFVGFVGVQQNGRRVQNTRGDRDKGVEYLPLRAAITARREGFQHSAGLVLQVRGLDHCDNQAAMPNSTKAKTAFIAERMRLLSVPKKNDRLNGILAPCVSPGEQER
jgi:hypothetical protein